MARTLQVESINSSSTGLDLQTLNASRLFIKSDGNVGIGGTPSTLLHLQATSPSLRIQAASGNSGALDFYRTASVNSGQIASESTNALVFSTNGVGNTGLAERLRIDSSGNVGIGTASPTAQVTIGKVVNSATLPSTPANHSISLYPPQTTGYYGGGISWSTGTYTAANICAVDDGGSGALGLVLSTGNNSAIAERLRIDSSGRVGIGITPSSQKLEVNGGSVFKGTIFLGDGSSSIIRKLNASTPLTFADQGGLVEMTINSSGSVGIGTDSPIEQLQVSGTGRIHLGNGSVATDTTAGIYFHTVGETNYAIHRTTGVWTASTYQQLRMSFATGIVLDGGTDAGDKSFVRVNGTGIRVATGNIGIGTTAKTLNYKLDVYGTNYNDCVRIAASSTSSGIDFFDTSSGSLARKGIIYTNIEGIGILNSAAAWALRVNQGTTNVVIPTGSLTVGQDILTNQNYGYGHVGVYSSERFQSVFAMSTAYTMKADGTSLSAGAGGNNFYGIAWSHPHVGGQGANLTDHGMLIVSNGVTKTAISSSIWCIGNITAYSDERVKTNWRNFDDNFIEKLAKVKSGIFDRTDVNEKENGLKTQVGVSAQSLKEVIPDAVTCNSEGMLSVSYGNAAMASCVELAKEILKLKEEIAKIKENK